MRPQPDRMLIRRRVLLRLCAEHRLDYKLVKYRMSIELVDRHACIRRGKSGYCGDQGYSGDAGI